MGMNHNTQQTFLCVFDQIHQRCTFRQFGEGASITPEQYPTSDTRRGSIHHTRAVCITPEQYPSHQSSIQQQTLKEEVSITPKQYPTPDT
ncbi:hypothetical protein ElyMa_002938400 [Elysia marginata]|uniref:Uncharacterized protein n=1 Tax=Elysia marginata TaxID=1093978 RepID=A0AAV4I7H7_9GAST|nr:hypothetical protein ElyMa_002938400 [Elysia marginata]